MATATRSADGDKVGRELLFCVRLSLFFVGDATPRNGSDDGARTATATGGTATSSSSCSWLGLVSLLWFLSQWSDLNGDGGATKAQRRYSKLHERRRQSPQQQRSWVQQLHSLLISFSLRRGNDSDGGTQPASAVLFSFSLSCPCVSLSGTECVTLKKVKDGWGCG
ncbi:uncharacterized protein LOC110265928 [Arachis ipaensis]|uniref:uncharacterized protein LOC110265928 n=1 Tax=Arachis ipaensis TaxID=130454 RepID=UPI000A2B0882|nr:uncharacterized protein LOC110265928 [Arachis ipaensis]